MIGYIKGSKIFGYLKKLSDWVAEKWDSSEIGWLFTRNLNDIKTRNSLTYKLLNTPFNWFGELETSDKFKKLASQSLLFNLASKFEYGVYAVVFLAPFIPTMALVALVMLTFVSFFINRIINGKARTNLDAIGFLFVLLVIIFGFFAITSLKPLSSIRIWMIYAPFIAFVYLVIKAADTKEKLRMMVALFITAGLFVSLYGIYQQFFGTNEGHSWLDDQMFSTITVRVYSTLENPNVLGEYLLLVIPICVAMLWTSKRLLSKVYYFGVLGTATLCMIFTQSRGCWLGLILAAAVFIILVDKRLIVIGVIALFALPFILPTSIITRFTSIGNLNDSSTSYRLYIWLGTINMLKDFGIYGIGLGSDAYNQIYPFYSYSSIIAPHAHNIYLQLLCETGIIGLGTFLISMIVSVKKIFIGFIADKKGLCGILCASVIAALFGFLLQGAFDYVWYNYRVFLIFWMIIGIGIAARRLVCDKVSSCNQ